MPKLPRQRAGRMLDQARLHLQRDEFDKAKELLEGLAADAPSAAVSAALGDARAGLDDLEGALEEYRRGLALEPRSPELHARLGAALLRGGRVAEALGHFERAEPGLARDPGFLTQFALALLQAGRAEDAERLAARAMRSGGGPETRLVQGLIWARRGKYREAEELAARLVQAQLRPDTLRAARALRADAKLFLGDAAGAVELWKGLEEEDALDVGQLGHFAYAAQLVGDPKLCDALIAERVGGSPTAEDLLLFAQISNLRGDPKRALELLDRSAALPGERHPNHGYEALATRGRALRLQGRREEARRALEEALRIGAPGERLAAQVQVDLGHLAAEEGDFEAAARAFHEALRIDPSDPEASRGRALTDRRVAWRTELAASAEARVDAARAEAEAMKRRFAAREGEVEALRRELEELKAARQDAEERARRAQEEAERARSRQVREELQSRELEVEQKADENVERALGPDASRCPPALRSALRVAERTYQQALYTDLPAAAVAVLYAGVLERALYLFFVEPFQTWLRQRGRLEEFLRAAIRERRGTRVEYFDHFVEAFDPERPGRAPSMGEVGRVLQRRGEPYLAAFAAFLADTYALDDGFYQALGELVLQAKERLRDPVAHGRAIDLGYEELRRLREALLFEFAGGNGVLRRVVAATGG